MKSSTKPGSEATCNRVKSPGKSVAFRIAFGYFLFATLWIFVSDFALGRLASQHAVVAVWQTGKGWFFVGVTALLLFLALRHVFRRLGAAQRSLYESEKRFRLLVTAVRGYAIYGLDAQGRVVTWNVGAERIKGWPAAEIIGQSFTRFYRPNDVAEGKPEQLLRQTAAEGWCEEKGWRVRRDGTEFYAHGVLTAVRDETGRLYGFAKVTRDVTEQRSRQRELERLTRLHATLSQVNHSIARIPDRQTLFAETCRILINYGGFKLAWIGWMCPAGRALEVVAQGGSAPGGLPEDSMRADLHDDRRGFIGTCIQEGRTCVCTDLATDPDTTRRCQGAAAQELAAAVAVPIRLRGAVCGALMAYAPEPDFFGPKEVAVLEAAAGDISFALDHQARQEEHRRAEEALRLSNARYHALFAISMDGILLAVPDGRILAANAAACAMLGRSEAEICRLGREGIVAPGDPRLGRLLEERQRRGRARGELAFQRADGTQFIAEVTSVVFESAEGPRTSMIIRDITDLHCAEAALRASEEKYRRLFDFESDALFLISRETGQILDANTAAQTMYGFTRDELLARRNVDLSAEPDQTREATARQLDCISTRWHQKQDGTVFPVEIHASHFRLEGREVHLAAIRDITQRQRAHEALAQSERKWRHVLVNTPQIGVSLDPEGRILFANRHLLELTGWPEEDVLGQNWFNRFIPPETREQVRTLFRTAMAACHTLGYSTYQHEVLTRTGERRNVAWSNVLTQDATGQITDVTCLGVDLTERQRAEAVLRQSEARYRRFFECDLTGDFVSTPDGRILDCNPAFARMLGFDSVDAALAADPARFYSDSNERAQFVWRLQDQRLIENIEVELVRCDGNRITVVENLVGQFDAEGRLFQWFGYMFDITGRKQLELALRDLATHTLRVQDEERRRIARELHDTTAQNLAALNMNLAVLEYGLPPDAARLRQLLIDCQHLTDQSAQEIRTLSYLLHPPLLEEFGLIRAARDYAEGFGQRSGIRMELDLDDSLERLPPNIELALFRVVQEALGNVHRHSGSPVATIRLKREPTAVRLEISDTGRGLPTKIADGKRPGGVGILGMRERLQQLGGRLELTSGLPGVRLCAILPLAQAGL